LKNPRVIAASCFGGSVCVAIDRSLIVFSDDTCSEVCFTYTFNSPIDCFIQSEDGLFIIVGVESTVHCFFCSMKGQLLFSRYIYVSLCNNNNNNNNNNNIYLLQLGCYLVAVIILHVNKT